MTALPDLAADLCRQFPAVSVHEVALSDREGEAEFHHVVTNSGYSGLRRRTYDRRDERVELIRVRTRRLDDVIPADHPVDLIKIDVEGAELEVLRGALTTLGRCRPHVIFEHRRGAAEHYGSTPAMVHRLFADCGLAVFHLDGTGPLPEEVFIEIFETNQAWNFLARPYRTQGAT